RIAPKALDKFKERVREQTYRTRGLSLSQIIEELTPYLIGWRGYFGFCQTPRVLTNLEAWIRRRLRSYLWRQWQNGRNRLKELRRRGVPKFNAAVAAGSPTGFWHMSGHPAVPRANAFIPFFLTRIKCACPRFDRVRGRLMVRRVSRIPSSARSALGRVIARRAVAAAISEPRFQSLRQQSAIRSASAGFVQPDSFMLLRDLSLGVRPGDLC